VRRASVKPFEFGVRTPGGLFLGVWYAWGIDFWRFRTPMPSDFRHNFKRPTRNDKDVEVVINFKEELESESKISGSKPVTMQECIE